jgi:hypothetical protein
MERWGQYFKPAGMGQATGDPHKPAAARAAAPVADEEDAPFDTAPAATPAPAAASAASADGASRAQDILAMIRNRQK